MSTTDIVDLVGLWESIKDGYNDQLIDLGTATQQITKFFAETYPAYNIMVVRSKHLQNFEESSHLHIELTPPIVGTVGFEIYVFKRGNFTLLGDGGYHNWSFAGNFVQDVAFVKFYDRT